MTSFEIDHDNIKMFGRTRRGENWIDYNYTCFPLDDQMRRLIGGAADLVKYWHETSPENWRYYDNLQNALVESMQDTGAKITQNRELIRLGDCVINFQVWCKCIDRKRCWQMSTGRIDLIAVLKSAKNKQAAIEKLIARELPQPIAEAIVEDFRGWLHYDIIVNA